MGVPFIMYWAQVPVAWMPFSSNSHTGCHGKKSHLIVESTYLHIQYNTVETEFFKFILLSHFDVVLILFPIVVWKYFGCIVNIKAILESLLKKLTSQLRG